jgi:hypothetical protein
VPENFGKIGEFSKEFYKNPKMTPIIKINSSTKILGKYINSKNVFKTIFNFLPWVGIFKKMLPISEY